MVLVDPVVVGKNGARTDVGVLAHSGVANVGQVRHLGAFADCGVFRLHKTAELAARAQLRAGADVRERADGGVLADDAELALRAYDGGAGADLHVGQGRVGPDFGAVADDGGAPQLGVGVDDHVAADFHLHADPGGGGVNHGRAVTHRLLDEPPVELLAGLRQLHPVVHACQLAGVRGGQRGDPEAVVTRDAQHVGDVELALGVVGGHALERVTQHRAVEREHAGVDLAHLALLVRGVLFFHDGNHVARLAPDDAAVAGGVVELEREHRHRRALRLVCVHERL